VGAAVGLRARGHPHAGGLLAGRPRHARTTALADELARRTPGATVHAVEGASHFLGYTHTREILSEFT